MPITTHCTCGQSITGTCFPDIEGCKQLFLSKTDNHYKMEPKHHPGSSYQNLFDYLTKEHGLTLLESQMNDLINVVHKFHPAGAVWVKASKWPKDHNMVHWRRADDRRPLLVIGRNYQDNIVAQFGKVYTPDELEWLDESGTSANVLPTFWDVAKAFKWAAEYRDEIGGHLTLYNDQWTIISEDEDGNENETQDLTPGNVAELYCLQNGFTKEKDESAAAREEYAVEFGMWLAKEQFESVNGKTMRSSNWNAGMPYSPSELYELFKQQKANP